MSTGWRRLPPLITGGGGGLDAPHDSHLQQEDNEDLNTGGGHEKIVSGIGVKVDPSYVLTIHDAGGGGGFGDNEDLDTGGGHEKFVSGVGDRGVNDVGGQGELGDNGVGQGEVDLQIVDKEGGHEKGELSESFAQDVGSYEAYLLRCKISK